MTFNLSVECDNAAFGESDGEAAAELGRILIELGRRFTGGEDGPEIRDAGNPMDVNGNRVGRWEFKR